MRPIDGDDLSKETGKLWEQMPDGEELSKELMKTINRAPTIDAVPVVRCKECRYWLQKFSLTEHWVCAHHSFDERKMYTMPDFYCADGERRESDEK